MYMIEDRCTRELWQRKLWWHGAYNSPFWMFHYLNVVAWLFGYGIDEVHYDWEKRAFIEPWGNLFGLATLVLTWHILSYLILCHLEVGRIRGAILLLIGVISVLKCHEYTIEFVIHDGLEKISNWILIVVEIVYVLETSWFMSVAFKAVRSQEYDDFGDEIIPLVSPSTAGIIPYETFLV